MKHIPLYPLRFEPIYQYRLWGGRRLAELLTAPPAIQRRWGTTGIVEAKDRAMKENNFP